MALQQVDPRQRIVDLDALRGFALFGILIVNIIYFGYPFLKVFTDAELFTGVGDQLTLRGVRFFFEGKFITLFSLLFGLGFTMMAIRFIERELPFYRVFYRRVAMLLVFGAAHFLLLWAGDILFIYGMCAILLPLFLNRSEKTLKIWIGIFLLAPIFIWALFAGMIELAMHDPEVAAELNQAREEVYTEVAEQNTWLIKAYSSASIANVFEARMIETGWMFKGMIFNPGGFFYIMAMFLIGVLWGKRNYARRKDELLPQWNRKVRWMLPGGLIFTLFYLFALSRTDVLWIDWWTIIGSILFIMGTPLLTMSYSVLFINAFQRIRESFVGNGLAAVGRTALSNYLLQSVIATTIFYGYGLGLYAQLSLPLLMLIALAIFLVQISLSQWYLRRWNMGPAEWLWRVVTYWKKPV